MFITAYSIREKKNYKIDTNLIPKDKEDKLLEILTPWLEKAKYVKTNAVGEVFASKIFVKFCRFPRFRRTRDIR